MSQTQRTRVYSAAHFVLELDGNDAVGFFRSVEGGGVKSDILDYRGSTGRGGSSHNIWRSLGKPQYEDIKIQVGMGMSGPFYDWIEAFFKGEVVRKSGAIVAGDFHYRERARREFSDALISELALPKLDATDRNACYMTVTLAPEQITFARGSNEKIDHTIGKNNQKLWTAANFKFFIDGFADACARVTKIDGFSIKQKILDYHTGKLRYATKVPGVLEFPNLTFYLPESDAGPLMDHFTKHVIDGVVREKPLTGAITIMDHVGGELCRIDLDGVDIASIHPDKSDASSEDIKQVKVEISVETMKFVYGEVAALE